MRFKLPVSHVGAQQAADGIGNFFRSMAMAPLYQAQAAEEAQGAQAKRDLIGAQQRQAEAHAALFQGQAESERQQQQRGSLGELIKTAAMMHGVAPSQTADFAQFAQTGQMPAQYRPPAVDGVGPFQPAPRFYQDDTASKIWKSLGLTNQALTIGDKSVENIAKASGVYRDQGLGDQVLAGQIDPGRVAEAQAAMDGKDRFKNIGDTGQGFNVFSGAEQDLSPGLAVLFGRKTDAGIGADDARALASRAAAGASTASASNSYAAAAQHRASTDKIRQDIAQGGRTGQLQVVPAFDGTIMLVNKATGEARPALGPGGVPLQGKGPPMRALPSAAAKGHLDNLTNLRRAENALALVQGKTVDGQEGDPNATGWKGFLPNTALNILDESGVPTRAAIADLGSLVIHDRSGAAVTAAEFPRLAPFIPRATDDPATVQKKLQMFVSNYRAAVDEASEFYRASGYTVPELGNRAPAAQTGGAGTGQMAAPPSGPRPGAIQDGYRFKGGDPSQAVNWEQVK